MFETVIVKDSYWMHPARIHSVYEVAGMLEREIYDIGSIRVYDEKTKVRVIVKKGNDTVYSHDFHYASYLYINNDDALEIDILFELIKILNQYFNCNLKAIVYGCDGWVKQSPNKNNIPSHLTSARPLTIDDVKLIVTLMVKLL